MAHTIENCGVQTKKMLLASLANTHMYPTP